MTRRGKFVVNKVSNARIHFIRDTPAPQSTAPQHCHNVSSSTPAQVGCGGRRVPHPPAPSATLTLTQKLEFVLTLVNRLLIGFVTVYLCWMSLRLDSKDIPWHAVFCTLGVSKENND